MRGDLIRISGRVRLTATDPRTGEIVAIVESENLFVTAGKTAILDALRDSAAQYDTGVTYLAIGTDTTPPALTDTALVSEVARKVISQKLRSGNTLTFSVSFPAADCTYNIKEVGLFGTSTATTDLDSGVLFARALLSYDNSAGLYVLTIDYPITIS